MLKSKLRFLEKTLELSTFLVFTVFLLAGSMWLFPNNMLIINDNEEDLALGISDSENSSVLGVLEDSNTLDQEADQNSKCSEKFPVTGWITRTGEKKILAELESGQKPSKCFRSLEEANQAGWYE